LGTWGTSREHDENTLGTRKKNKRKLPPTPPPKGRKRAHHEYILSLPIGYMKFLFPKLFVTIAVYT
jgi:hypothetical protein